MCPNLYDQNKIVRASDTAPVNGSPVVFRCTRVLYIPELLSVVASMLEPVTPSFA